MATTDDKKKGAEARKLTGWLASDPVAAGDHVLKAIAEGRGSLPAVAQKLGVGERTLDRIMADHPALAKVANDMRTASHSLETARAAMRKWFGS
jgi:hypothetical protein